MHAVLDTSPSRVEAGLTPLLTPVFAASVSKHVEIRVGEAVESQHEIPNPENPNSVSPNAGDHFSTFPILEIKLHRPHVTDDLIERPRLYAKLISGQLASLTLVSAPAGYGKTTLLGSWLERSNQPGAWLLLDEDDNSLVTFLTYFVAAIRTVFPTACPKTADALNNTQLSISWLAATLANELDRLPSRMTFVLDDVQVLHNQVVMQFLAMLLRYPLSGVHFVLIGRKDPFLPLARLRAQGQLTEIRVTDLRFTHEEATSYFARMVAVNLSASVTESLEKQTEGWITGLRLAALTITRSEDADALVQRASLGTRHIMDYLAEEVIARQEPAVREYLLMASLTDRFCAPLLDAMSATRGLPWTGTGFLEWLERADLFVIPLDNKGEWFRFHFLFQQLLRHMVQAHFGSNDVSSCHLRISAWYANQGMITEALHHALAGGDEAAAIRLIEENLNDVLNREDGPALCQWLARLPEHLIDRHPVLLLARAHSLSIKCRFAAVIPCIERAEILIAKANVPLSTLTLCSLRCSIKMLRCQDAYWRGDAAICITLAQEVLDEAALGESFVRGNAQFYLSLAGQRLGEGEVALQQLAVAIAERSDLSDAYTHWLHLAMACLYHYQGDLPRVIEVAHYLVNSVHNMQHTIILGWAHCLLGNAWYQRNQLVLANQHFVAVSQLRSQTHIRAIHGSLHGQATICIANEALDEADELTHMARELADDVASPELITDSRAFLARLALLHGEVAQAEKLLPTVDSHTNAVALLEFPSSLVRARILMAEATETSHHQALTLLESLIQHAESVHDTRLLIAALVLQSLVLQTMERPRAGAESLRRAIELAEPRDFRRLFLDEGPVIVPLLQELARKGIAQGYIGQLLSAIREPGEVQPIKPAPPVHPGSQGLIEALTYRELDVLELLAQRLSNQEIADKLVISPATARTHLANIYQKLHVGSRRQAVLRARELAII